MEHFQCGCDSTRWVFRLPKDTRLLADTLGLPEQTITEMISNGKIPIRHEVDSLGRRRATVVLIHDALDAIKALSRDTQ